ncbi:MAG: prepilin-type N-terminal cleavage/methylation domain-containing protein [Arcobacteraceae bacterium]|jgi:prepilin-type N-terminal cleavage/methylation domain-containing protein
MRKAFTLIEVIISISIFSVMLLAMYKTLNITKHSNAFLTDKLKYIDNVELVRKIIVEDVAESTSLVEISDEKKKNSKVSFITNNSYHFKSSVSVSYFLSENNNLIRTEATTHYKKEKKDVDILMKNVEKFLVLKTKEKDSNNYLFSIKLVDSDKFQFFDAITMNKN